MTSVTVTVRETVPLVPVIVSAYVPGVEPERARIEKVDVDVVGFGLNDAVVRLGRPLTLRLTEPLKPFSGLTVIAYVVVAPRATVREVGEAESVKSGAAACTTSCTDAVCVSEPLVPVIVTG
jgi:hypothetical protein